MRLGLLRRVPSPSDLERLYFELAQRGAPSVGARRSWPYRATSDEALLALAGDMLRYDPRLLSILLQYTLEHWQTFNPRLLREEMERMRWPQALLVVLEFAKVASDDAEFRYFADYISAGHERVAPPERFFIDSAKPGSRVAARNLGRNLAPYARWGFISNERPTANAFTKQVVGRYDIATRRRILQGLAERHSSFTLAEYLAEVDHAISRQQALRDLQTTPDLRRTGHGRGAQWRVTARTPDRKRPKPPPEI